MGVLIVEDEPRIAFSIKTSLEQEGFQVEQISSYEELQTAVNSPHFSPRIIVLDRLLGAVDSIVALKSIRERVPNSGILILSALSSVNEKAHALESGADDYLSKPFSTTELLARVKALSRRTDRPIVQPHTVIKNVIIDIINRTITVDGKCQTLPNREFLVLKKLALNPGRVFSKAEVFQSVWEMSAEAETNVVESTINSLRRRLETYGALIRIKNMRNAGYWIES